MIEPINNFFECHPVLDTGSQEMPHQVRHDNKKQEELMGAARQFEAVFINKMFKAMDATIEREDGFLTKGKGEQMFRSMFFDEVAKDIATNPTTSMGLAQQIYEQMKDRV